MGRRATMNARKRNRRLLYGSVVVAVIGLVLVFVLIYQAATNDPYSKYIGQPVATGVLKEVTGVSDSTLAAVGEPSGVSPPAKVTGTELTSNGLPEVLYVGAEYCPYCAIERWSLIMALSHFGTFKGIYYMQSSSTDVNPNTPTFTFINSTYTSKYIAFVPVEEYNRAKASLTNLTTTQSNLFTQYDVCAADSSASDGFPFVDIANTYAVNCGAQSALDISNENWTTIASQLNDSSSSTAQLIDGAANTLISAICNVDGGQPTSVCSQSFATVSIGGPISVSNPVQSYAVAAAPERVEPKWTA